MNTVKTRFNLETHPPRMTTTEPPSQARKQFKARLPKPPAGHHWEIQIYTYGGRFDYCEKPRRLITLCAFLKRNAFLFHN